MMKRLLLVGAAMFALCATVLSASPSATELIMVEEPGCPWCVQWERDLGPIYPKSPEGKYAPLRKVQLHDIKRNAQQLGVTPQRPVMFTPTFLLIKDGQELTRLEGYPGEDFFWGLLGRMLNDHTDYRAPDPAK